MNNETFFFVMQPGGNVLVIVHTFCCIVIVDFKMALAFVIWFIICDASWISLILVIRHMSHSNMHKKFQIISELRP